MASPKIYQHNRIILAGFTLVEVLLVLALLSVIASGTLFFSSNYYQSKSLMVERASLVSALKVARIQAMNNKDGAVHGVAINPSGFVGYVTFAGHTLAASDVSSQTKFVSRYSVSFASNTPAEIIFSQLSGDCSFSGEIEMFDLSRVNASTSILINAEGALY